MSLRWPTEYENGGTSPHGAHLDSSFLRTRESRFVPHRISLDTRFRGYDVIQVALPRIAGGRRVLLLGHFSANIAG
jgi:hypothetical protein